MRDVVLGLGLTMLLVVDDRVGARLNIEARRESLWDLLVTSNEQSDNPLARFLFDRSGSPVRWLRVAIAEPPAQSSRMLGGAGFQRKSSC